MRGSLREQAPHTTERYKTLRANLAKTFNTLEPVLGRRETDLLYHNVGGDARMLMETAARWEDHCRKTGQNPWRWTNEDGSPDKETT